jgi:hypothetical protein
VEEDCLVEVEVVHVEVVQVEVVAVPLKMCWMQGEVVEEDERLLSFLFDKK